MNKQPNDKKQRKNKKPEATDEPGKRYWLVFGQIHFVKAATATKPAKRRQVRLAEYLTTESLDHVGEITEAIKKQFEGTGTAERVEIWQAKEMSRQKWQSKRKDAPKEMFAVIHFQPELWTPDELTSARPATLCPMPGVKDAGTGKDAGNEAQAQESGGVKAVIVGGGVAIRTKRLEQCTHGAPQCSRCFAEMLNSELGQNAPEAIRNRCAAGDHFWSLPNDGVIACAFCPALRNVTATA